MVTTFAPASKDAVGHIANGAALMVFYACARRFLHSHRLSGFKQLAECHIDNDHNLSGFFITIYYSQVVTNKVTTQCSVNSNLMGYFGGFAPKITHQNQPE
jgi:hypothetical protein